MARHQRSHSPKCVTLVLKSNIPHTRIHTLLLQEEMHYESYSFQCSYNMLFLSLAIVQKILMNEKYEKMSNVVEAYPSKYF